MWTKKVLGLGITCGVISTVFLFISLFTDDWYIVDASTYRKQCRKDEQLQRLYPWDDEVGQTTVTSANGVDDRRLSTMTTTQIQLVLGDETISPIEKPYNDWSGIPLLGNRVPKPLPLIMAKQRGDVPNGSSNSSKDEMAKKSEENGESVYLKVARWNGVMQKIQSNLRAFGGRDTSRDRQNSNLPNAIATAFDCGDDTQKSVKMESSLPCVAGVQCSSWQFSTRAGLWRRCLSVDRSSVLSEILERGKIPLCASVRYSNVYKEDLPGSLKEKERNDAYNDEWKALHLQRILVSFLCIAAPVQIFGVIIAISGWAINRDFDIYAGGIVLVMSGTFQLFAIWTSGLLFELELSRKPEAVYGFPKGVTQKFGSSAHALWLSSGNTLFSGLICAVTPSIFSIRRRKIKNNVSTYALRPPMESCEESRKSDSVDMVVQIKPISPTIERKKPFKRQACSVDTAKYLVEQLIPLQDSLDSSGKGITSSTPNLRQLDQPGGLTRGPSTIGRLRRSSVTIAPMSLPVSDKNDETASLRLLQETDASVSQRFRISSRQKSFDGTSSQRSLTLLRMSSRHSLRSLRSLSTMSPVNESDLSCWKTVEISQRLRHARYARRTSHSHEEAAKRIQHIMRGASLEDPRRTKSLPRPSMRQTLSAETTLESNERAGKDHGSDLSQFHPISPAGSEIVPRTRGRAAYLSSLARNFSDDATTKRTRLLHPQIIKLSQDGSILSRSSDDSRSFLNRSLSRESSRSYVLERETTLDSVRECSESSHTSSSDENLMKNSLEVVKAMEGNE